MTVCVVTGACSNKNRLFVLRSTAISDASRERPTRLLESLGPRSGGSSPTTVIAAAPAHRHDGHGLDDDCGHDGHDDGHGLGREDEDVEDLILNNESRRTMMNSTRGVAQLAASRRGTRHPRPQPSSYVTISG